MLKRLILSLALSMFVAQSWAAGTVPGFSLTTQFYGTVPAAGCKLYVVQAGTTSTPQDSYQDSGLTLKNPNPLTCDASGRLPQFFLADGQIKLRLTTSTGTQIFVQDNLLVIGASSGGGGGGSVDPTTILQTGQVIDMYGTGNLTGFVRCNARTIGNASSGATERANADTSALFSYLWGADSNLAVSGGRGASAAADFAANKALTLPDCRGRTRYGDDAMGNSAASRLTSSYFGAASALGAVGGNEKTALTSSGQLPAHNHAVFLNDPGHTHTLGASNGAQAAGVSDQAGSGVPSGTGTQVLTLTSARSNTTGITVRDTSGGGGTANQTATTGSGTAFATASPGIVVTTYLKL